MRKILFLFLFLAVDTLLFPNDVLALKQCGQVSCGGPLNNSVNVYCYTLSSDPSADDCAQPNSCIQEDCPAPALSCQSDAACAGKVTCGGLPDSCITPKCNFLYGACQAICQCAAPTPTPIPVGGGGPPPTPTPTSPSCNPSFNCVGFSAYDLTTTGVGNTPSSYAHGKGIGRDPYGDTFGSFNTLNINPGDVVAFSTFKGGINDPAAGVMGDGNGSQITRTQFITRDRSIDPQGKSADVIGSCIMVQGNPTQAICLTGNSRLAWNTANTPWPNGYWPYNFLPTPPNFSSYNPTVISQPTFTASDVVAGITRTFTGACTSVRAAQCCDQVTLTSSTPTTQNFTCTHTDDDPCTRVFTPASCQVSEFGITKSPFDFAHERTMRKQFTSPGAYVVEATEQFACGTGGDNNQNPCAIQVNVGGPPPTTSGPVGGSLDKAFCPNPPQASYIQGWAYNSSSPSAPVTVYLRDGTTAASPLLQGGILVANEPATGRADGFNRQDIINANVCPGSSGGNGHCLFTYTPPAASTLNDGNTHTISAWTQDSSGTWTQLPNSPLSYNPAAGAVLATRNNHCAPPPPPSNTLSGNVFNDINLNGFKDPIESGVSGVKVTATPSGGSGLAASAITDANGNYTIPNLVASWYDVTVDNTTLGGRYVSVPTSLPVQQFVSGNTVQQFALGDYYKVQGFVFNDMSKNTSHNDEGLSANGQGLASGMVTITGPGVSIPLTVNGAAGYSSTLQLKSGDNATGAYTYTATLNANLVSGYNFLFPPAPPTFTFKIGYFGCFGSGPTGITPVSPDAICEMNSQAGSFGDISHLNFAVTNSIPWVQFQGLDVRTDGGFKNTTNAAPANVQAACSDAINGPSGAGYSAVSQY